MPPRISIFSVPLHLSPVYPKKKPRLSQAPHLPSYPYDQPTLLGAAQGSPPTARSRPPSKPAPLFGTGIMPQLISRSAGGVKRNLSGVSRKVFHPRAAWPPTLRSTSPEYFRPPGLVRSGLCTAAVPVQLKPRHNPRVPRGRYMVGRAGIEPATPGFSIPCSTD